MMAGMNHTTFRGSRLLPGAVAIMRLRPRTVAGGFAGDAGAATRPISGLPQPVS